MDTKKAVALLAYLAATGGTTAREQLIELLWPDQAPERGRAVFRRTLSALRSGLGGRFVHADRDRVRLDLSEVDLDTARAEQLTRIDHGHDDDRACPRCVKPLSAAAALFRGDFLQGFYVRDSPQFEGWQSSETERWRRFHALVLSRLADAYAAAGRYEEAASVTRRRIGLDPLHEPAYRHLMLQLAWAGDRGGAVEAYRSCVRHLDEELGVPPLEETTELYEAILDEDLPPQPGPATARRLVSAAPLMKSALVGREPELAALQSALEAGEGVVVVRGEPGVGKSRLLEALTTMAHDLAIPVVNATAYRSESDLGFGVEARLLQAAIDSAGGADVVLELVPEWVSTEVARLLPDMGPAATAGDESLGDVRMLEAQATMLVAAAGGAKPVLVVDDAQWVDQATGRLLTYVARRSDRWPMLIVLAYRPEDLAPNHSLLDVIEEAAWVLEPGPLTSSDVAALVALTAKDLDADLLHRRTGGLPLLVVDALESGTVDEVSPTVRRAVSARLDDLSSLATQLLTVAAVLDRPLDLEILGEVSGRGLEEAVDAIEDLTRRGLLRPEDRGSLGFRHDVIRTVVYERATPVRLRLLHRRAAEVLGRATDPASVGMAAFHYERGGAQREAAEAHQRAGDLARGIYAGAEAVTHYEAALALGHPEVTEVRTSLGDLATLAGDYESALNHYRAAAARTTGAVLAVIEHRQGDVERRTGNWEAAERHFRSAETEHPAPSSLYADWALLEHRRGHPGEAARFAALALEHANASGDSRQEARALNVLGVVTADPDKARHSFEASLALAGTDPFLRMAPLNNLATLAQEEGDPEAALEHLEEALHLSITVGDRHREAAILDVLAGVLRALRRTAESEDRQRQAMERFADVEAATGQRLPEIWLLRRW